MGRERVYTLLELTLSNQHTRQRLYGIIIFFSVSEMLLQAVCIAADQPDRSLSFPLRLSSQVASSTVQVCLFCVALSQLASGRMSEVSRQIRNSLSGQRDPLCDERTSISNLR